MEEHRLTSEKILAYDHWLRHEERAPGTIEKYLRDIRAFAACLDGMLLRPLPAEKLRRQTAEKFSFSAGADGYAQAVEIAEGAVKHG